MTTPEMALMRAVQREVKRGGRVESQTQTMAVIRYGKSTNHVLHLLLTLITIGFWLLVWVPIALKNGVGRRAVSLTVDPAGHVTKRRL